MLLVNLMYRARKISTAITQKFFKSSIMFIPRHTMRRSYGILSHRYKKMGYHSNPEVRRNGTIVTHIPEMYVPRVCLQLLQSRVTPCKLETAFLEECFVVCGVNITAMYMTHFFYLRSICFSYKYSLDRSL